jgi:ligand-binding SRPBCC domain-containing protein
MHTATYTFTLTTPLQASAETVWAHASTFAGVNRELWPIVRMTCPPALSHLTSTFPLGQRAFRSWILALGFLPIEYDDITPVELDPGRGFSEVSRLFAVREWRHRRSIRPAPPGCVVTDEIALTPRIPGTGWLLARIYRVMFAWRHRRLRRLFELAPSTTPTIS